MNVGILGTGFGAFHAELYKTNPLVGDIKIWGRDKVKREAVASRHNIEAAESMEALIRDPAVGLIDVCLPNALHRDAILAALKAGKHVYCETPVCTSPEDAETIKKVAADSEGKVFVNQFIKFFPEYRNIHSAVCDGRHGKLLSLHAWRNTSAIWGELGYNTITTNLMIHELDFITWVMGEPQHLQVTGTQKNGSECLVSVGWTCGGASALVTASSMMPAGYPFTAGFTAVFEHAAIEFTGQFPDGNPIKHTTLYTPESAAPLPLPQVNPYEAAINHVLECCQYGKPSDLDIHAALVPVCTAIAIREALQKE